MTLDRDDDDWDVDPDRPVPPPGQDALPWEDDEPMESQRHVVQMHLLIDTLADAWAERRDFFVGGNMFVYFSELQAQGKKKFRGPDVFVVRGTERKPRKSWVVWEEERYPDVVIELLSKTTEHVDRGEKMRVYASAWRLPELFLYDPETHVLEGYELDAARGVYVASERDARGDLPVRSLGLSLGLRDGDQHELPGPFLRWIDEEGCALPTGSERAERERLRADAERERADAERERADAERERADAAERRAQELEAELARRR